MRDSLVSKNDTNMSLIKEGFATYYKEGKICADGSKFNVNNLTVAFYTNQSEKREWLGKKLLLKYSAASVIVKVTDNGNFLPLGNSIDCTPAVFKALNIPLEKGKVKIQIFKYGNR